MSWPWVAPPLQAASGLSQCACSNGTFAAAGQQLLGISTTKIAPSLDDALEKMKEADRDRVRDIEDTIEEVEERAEAMVRR